jgi:hypothetical protein
MATMPSTHSFNSGVHALGRKYDREPFSWTDIHDKVPDSLKGTAVVQRWSLCVINWEAFAKFVILLGVLGWCCEEIADYLGMSPEEDVRPILGPKPVVREVAEFQGMPQEPELLKESYDEIVARHIHFQTARVCWLAQLTADEEGYPDLKSQLSDFTSYHAGEATKLEEFFCPPYDAGLWWPPFLRMYRAARHDADIALGIVRDPNYVLRPLILDHMRTPEGVNEKIAICRELPSTEDSRLRDERQIPHWDEDVPCQ